MAKILVVDDSSLSRRILTGILKSAGHQVVEAADGVTALERYFLEKPEVVFLDLLMGGMYGLDVLQKLRQMDPEARVIVATADIQTSTREMAVAAGAHQLITKPFGAESVLAAVGSALGTR